MRGWRALAERPCPPADGRCASPSSADRTSANRRLFNRLVGKRLALVDDLPGVTRDRREGEAHIGGLDFVAIDTAGLDEAAPDSLAGRMRAQTEAAVRSADVSLFVIDARAGLTPLDRHFAELLRTLGKPIVLVANKAEGTGRREPGVLEAYALGFGDPVAISAEHGEGLGDLHGCDRWPIAGEGTRRREPRRGGRGGRSPADPRCRRRPPERRQVDADQPHDRRGPPAHRPRSRHHPRFDRRRLAVAGARLPPVRHGRSPPQGARRRQAREARRRRRAARDPLRRGGDPRRSMSVSRSRSRTCRSPTWSRARAVPSSSRSTSGIWSTDRQRTMREPARSRRSACCRRSPASRLVPVSGVTGEGIDRLMEAVLAAPTSCGTGACPTARLNRWLPEVLRAASAAGRRRPARSSCAT